MAREHDAARTHEVDLARDELREATLHRRTVDVAATGGGEDGHVRRRRSTPVQWPDVS